VNRIRPIFAGLTIAALIVLIGSLIASSVMSNGAKLVQLIEPQDAATASLFGDATTLEPSGLKIGSPQLMVVRDQKAFLEGAGSSGERFVSKTYLDQHGLYPLQVKTITFFRDVTALISGVVAVLFGALWWLGSRKKPSVLA
jgi:hypothetical protein